MDAGPGPSPAGASGVPSTVVSETGAAVPVGVSALSCEFRTTN